MGHWSVAPRVNTNRLTHGRTTPFRSAHGINGACCLLNFDCCSGFRKFLLDRFSFVFAYAFFDGFRCAFDKILRFLQTETGNFTNSFDDTDFVTANCSQNDIELSLLLRRSCCGCRAATCSRSSCDCCGCCADTKSLFQALDELGGFEQRQSLNFIDDALNLRHCYLLRGIILEISSARLPASEQQPDCE